MGKYGDEGDNLIYKIINSGDFLRNLDSDDIATGYKSVLPALSEKGLRYDLTVPFARYVAMNRNEITLPFKRYQIQPVWRADRPQKGRYREFFQCDADVIGSDSLFCEAEMILMIQEIFDKLGIRDYSIRVNHRQILSKLAEIAGGAGKELEFCIAIDKLQKIGATKVRELLIDKGFDETTFPKIFKILGTQGSPKKILQAMGNTISESMAGITDLKDLFSLVEASGKVVPELIVDASLARGLTYYTGVILEVSLEDGSSGSLAGGGRYDDLTGAFGWKGIPGVGFSLGIDRMYDVMEARNLFPGNIQTPTRVLIATFDEASFNHALSILTRLRDLDITAEMYPAPVKIKKQLDYANFRKIPYVVLIGDDEIQTGKYTLKNMKSGDQSSVALQEIENTLMI